MSDRTPPRFVPTLTEVVSGGEGGVPTVPVPLPAQLPEYDQLVARVMQRVDLVLERRLREAIAASVLEHTSILVPHLREQVQAAVHETVAQVLAELREQQKP